MREFHDLFSNEVLGLLDEAGRPVAGWFCTYTPVEMLHAAGYTPVRIAGLRAPTGAADALSHTNICPYMKACLDAAESGALDFLKVAVFTNGCDAQRRMYDIWKTRRSGLHAHLLTVPKLTGAEQVARYAAELETFAEWLGEVSGAPLSDEKLEESISLYQNLRGLLKEVDALRSDGGRISGGRALELLLSAQHMPPEAAVSMLEKAIGDAPAEGAGKGPSVLLYGNMIDGPELAYIIEKYGARIVADDLCAGRRFTDTCETGSAEPPVRRLASVYLNKRPCPRMVCTPDAADNLITTVRETKPDGVVLQVLKFCDTHLYDVPRLREELRELGVKTLFLETDYTPVSGQAETRVQAFVEMLGE